jgi:hypothetical protein
VEWIAEEIKKAKSGAQQAAQAAPKEKKGGAKQ